MPSDIYETAGSSVAKKPRVAVWRSQWLPAGETFIRNHVQSVHRWQAVPFGADREETELSSPEDVILFSPEQRWSRRVFEETGRSRRVTQFLRDGVFDLVHAHMGMDAVDIAPACRQVGLPLVVTLHGQDVTSTVYQGGMRGVIYRKRLRRTLDQAAEVLAVSEHLAERAREFGCDKVRVHVLGVPLPDRLEPDSERDWDIVFAGRLVAKKGTFDLLEALAQLRDRGLRVRTAFAGDGPLREDLQREARERGVDVSFLGFRLAEEVRQLMSRSAVVAVPSVRAADGDTEGLPTVAMEAAAVGRPVVGYRHSGIAEAVDHNITGLLGEEGDVTSLSQHFEQLLVDEPRRLQMGAAARRKAEQEFDIARQTRALESSVYDPIARREVAI